MVMTGAPVEVGHEKHRRSSAWKPMPLRIKLSGSVFFASNSFKTDRPLGDVSVLHVRRRFRHGVPDGPAALEVQKLPFDLHQPLRPDSRG